VTPVETFFDVIEHSVSALGCARPRGEQVLPGDDAPMRAKLIAGTSLSAWIAMPICGRLITFFRPPIFH